MAPTNNGSFVGALAWAGFAFERVPAQKEGILPIKPKREDLVCEPPKFCLSDESIAMPILHTVRYGYALSS